MKNLSIIILNYNDAITTSSLADSLVTWDSPELELHIIIVDNKSADDSYRSLKRKYAHIENVDVILSERNGGYSYGNNFGARFAMEQYQSNYIAIANPDIQIDCETVLRLLETFDADDQIGMAAPVMKDTHGNFEIKSLKLPTYKEDLLACFNSTTAYSVLSGKFEYLNGNKSMIITQMLPGSFFVMKSAYLKEIGMLDENVFLFCEERILGRKLLDRNYKLVLRADLYFIHAHSVTINKAYDRVKSWRILMNSRFYYEKNYNQCSMIQLLVLKICMQLFIIGLPIESSLYRVVQRVKNVSH